MILQICYDLGVVFTSRVVYKGRKILKFKINH